MSISFDEALSIAKELNPDVDYYVEDENSYTFSQYGLISIGGYGSPVVVLKENGDAINFVAYIGMYEETPVIKEGSIDATA